MTERDTHEELKALVLQFTEDRVKITENRVKVLEDENIVLKDRITALEEV